MKIAYSAALALAILAPQAHAASLGDTFTSFFVFGDSLSDPGNLPDGAAPPSPPYFSDLAPFALPSVSPLTAPSGTRFSSGPVWAEDVAGDFGATAEVGARNFAFGGAQIADGGLAPDFTEQLGLFGLLDGLPTSLTGTNDLASIWLGANDLFAAITTASDEVEGGGSFDDALAGAVAAARAAAGAVADGVALLAGAGFENVAVFNLPDLGSIPLFTILQPEDNTFAADATQAFNETLEAELASADTETLDVTLIDIDAIFQEILADPATLGFVGPPFLPCVIPGVSACGDPDGLIFFDPVHPTAEVHDIIADQFRAALAPAPVPLPAGLPLLLAGLGGFAFLRRKVAR